MREDVINRILALDEEQVEMLITLLRQSEEEGQASQALRPTSA